MSHKDDNRQPWELLLSSSLPKSISEVDQGGNATENVLWVLKQPLSLTTM